MELLSLALKLHCGSLQSYQNDTLKLIIQEFKKKILHYKPKFYYMKLIKKSVYQKIKGHLINWFKIANQNLNVYR